MSPPAPSGLVHSIQERLKNEAHRTGRPYVELLELFAVERFLQGFQVEWLGRLRPTGIAEAIVEVCASSGSDTIDVNSPIAPPV